MTTKDWQCNKRLVECLGHMLDSATCSDVSFLVGGAKEVVHAHKLILISRSPVFYAMFEGPLAEKGEVTVSDIDKDIFELFLRYLYTDDVKLTCDNVTYLLYTAKKYCVDLLAQECNEFINRSLKPENACTLLEHAHLCGEDKLATECRKLIFENPQICLQSHDFQNLCSPCVLGITDSDDLMTSEDDIYRAVMKWSDAECRRQTLEINDANKRQVLGDIIYTVRFLFLSTEVFQQDVMYGDVLSYEEMIKIHRIRNKQDYKSDLKFKSSPRNIRNKIEKVIRCQHFWIYGSLSHPILKNCDALSFQLSCAANFHGIGIYGAKDGIGVHIVELRLYDEDDKVLNELNRIINTDPTADIFDIRLDSPVQLRQSTVYTVAVNITGPDTKRGVNGNENMSVGGIDITFTTSRKSRNDTSVSGGQIPCLLLSRM